VRRTVPPSAEIEVQIDQLLAVGVGDSPRESLSELARLGAPAGGRPEASSPCPGEPRPRHAEAGVFLDLSPS
jgi:hypothetical protein